MSEHIYWIGDSTVQTNNITTWPQCGMGQVLSLFIRPEVAVHNHAKNGRSTKSFRDEGLWEPVRQALQAGDFLFIQFGHNDEKEQDPARYATPEGYAENLLRYAREAQAVGALPVIITPLARRLYTGEGIKASHGPYPEAAKAMAAAEGLPLIDLTAASTAMLEQITEPESLRFFMNFGPGLYPNYPEGKADNTHLRHEGAVTFTQMVVQGLAALGGKYSGLLLGAQAPDLYDGKAYEG